MSGRADASAPSAHPAITTELLVDGEFTAVLHDERTNALHRLNPSASAVWVLCDGRTDLGSMATELAELFDLEPAASRAQVERALDTFDEAALLSTSPPPVEPSVSAEAKGDRRVLTRLPDP